MKPMPNADENRRLGHIELVVVDVERVILRLETARLRHQVRRLAFVAGDVGVETR